MKDVSKNVLVIVGSDLSVNSSANLCHKAYIDGLLENGYAVDVLTVSANKEVIKDNTCELVKYGYKMESVYEKLGKLLHGKKDTKKTNVVSTVSTAQSKKGKIRELKNFIISLYGPYETYGVWKRQAIQFSSEKEYDLVLSLSFPPVSHLLAHELIKKRHIKTRRWIQVWEDPWCQDLIFVSLRNERAQKRAQKEEARLLKLAEEVLYVSPITLANQKAMFTESVDKMDWEPVPSYYQAKDEVVPTGEAVFGYFGDYSSKIRNLVPFYEAAKQIGATVNICGSSDKMAESVGNIVVRPRISLEELKPIEAKTNVLVFVANLRGGQIPGKIYQYAATHKTVLFILDGTEEEQKILKNYFEKFNRFVFCENNVEDISKAMKKIQSGDIGKVKNEPIEYFSPKAVIERILEGQ